jgi:lysophospholipid acyltransferase (LPLAT)-like uncharacterized protein
MTEVARSRGLSIAFGARWAIGLILGVVARVWLWTLRVQVVEDPALEVVRDRPWVLAFFHGTQWPLLAWRRRRPTLVMVSWSLDGAIQSRALRTLGFSVVRGSTSRGGMRGLAQLTRAMKQGGRDAAFAVDGPRGPYGVAQGGAQLAARASGGVVVPMGSAFVRGVVLEKAWDRFGIAWPFSRVSVALGAPVDAGGGDPAGLRAIEAAIAAANAWAHDVLTAHATRPLSLSMTDRAAGTDAPSK